MLTRAFKNYDGKCNITETEKNELSSVLSRYQGISVGLDGKLGRTNKVEHTINTGEKPIKLPPPQTITASPKEIAETHKGLY